MEGVDFNKTFSPVAFLESIRLLMEFACTFLFRLYQIDVRSAFLNGYLNEEVSMTQSKGFKDPTHPEYVYKLKKALYGLKQAPKAWYERLSNYLFKKGYSRGGVDRTLFIKRNNNDVIVAHVYVDDIVFGPTSHWMVDQFVKYMSSKFEMNLMGELTYFPSL